MSTSRIYLKGVIFLKLVILFGCACAMASCSSGNDTERGLALKDGVVILKYSYINRPRYVLGPIGNTSMSFWDFLESVYLQTEDISIAARWIQDHCGNKTLFSICPLWQGASKQNAPLAEELSLGELRLLFGGNAQGWHDKVGGRRLYYNPPIVAIKCTLSEKIRYVFGMSYSGIPHSWAGFLDSAYLITSDLSVAANWIRCYCEDFSWLVSYVPDDPFGPGPPPYVEPLSADELRFLRVNSL